MVRNFHHITPNVVYSIEIIIWIDKDHFNWNKEHKNNEFLFINAYKTIVQMSLSVGDVERYTKTGMLEVI